MFAVCPPPGNGVNPAAILFNYILPVHCSARQPLATTTEYIFYKFVVTVLEQLKYFENEDVKSRIAFCKYRPRECRFYLNSV